MTRTAFPIGGGEEDCSLRMRGRQFSLSAAEGKGPGLQRRSRTKVGVRRKLVVPFQKCPELFLGMIDISFNPLGFAE